MVFKRILKREDEKKDIQGIKDRHRDVCGIRCAKILIGIPKGKPPVLQLFDKEYLSRVAPMKQISEIKGNITYNWLKKKCNCKNQEKKEREFISLISGHQM